MSVLFKNMYTIKNIDKSYHPQLAVLLWEAVKLRSWVSGIRSFPDDSVIKNPPANAGDASSIPRSGGSPGEGNGNPLQYSCLGNPMDRRLWQAAVHGITKSQTWLSIHTHNTHLVLQCLASHPGTAHLELHTHCFVPQFPLP